MSQTQDEGRRRQTEAACLLQTGALYHERIGLDSERGDFIFAGFKRGVFSIYFDDSPIFHFDLEGRWQHAYVRDRHYLKRLEGSVQEINRVREGANLVLKRRTLDPTETRLLDAEVRDVARVLRTDLDAGAFRLEGPPEEKARRLDDGRLREFLARIAGWDGAAWNAHRAAYNRTYGPLPFTPPSCQNAVILQATWGDRAGRSFGAGEAHPYGARDVEAFESHVRAVVDLFGRRLEQTKGVFLGGADVLRRSADDLLGSLDAIRRGLPPGQKIEDVHVFIDDFSDPIPASGALAQARARGLSHAALGVESGAPDVRRLYGKAWSDEELRGFVGRAKEAAVALSVLILVGAGGTEHASDHVARTASLIESLPLSGGDLVFLLDEREVAATPLAGVSPLNQAAWSEQLNEFRQVLSGLRDRGVKVLPYSMAKQWA